MDRSLWAVLAGTFTLRFSTGLTGAMLGVYLADLPEHGGPEVDADRRRPVRRDVLPRRARPVADLRDPVRPARPPPGDALRPGLRGDRRRHDRADDATSSILGGHAAARGRVDRGQRPVDPRLHRARHGRQRAACAARRRPGSRARRWPGSARVRRRADRCSRRSARRRSSSTPCVYGVSFLIFWTASRTRPARRRRVAGAARRAATATSS